MSQFCGSLSGLRSRSGVTSAASMGDAASMLPANSVMRIEPMRLAMNASHRVCAPLRCDDGLVSNLHHLGGGVRRVAAHPIRESRHLRGSRDLRTEGARD